MTDLSNSHAYNQFSEVSRHGDVRREKEGKSDCQWDERRECRGNFISFILLHLKAVIYARGEVRRSAPEERARGGERERDGEGACVPVRARKRHERRHYNRYVSMQTLSFIRLPVWR